MYNIPIVVLGEMKGEQAVMDNLTNTFLGGSIWSLLIKFALVSVLFIVVITSKKKGQC